MLNRGYWVTTLLSVVGLAITTYVMMHTNGGAGHRRLPDLDLLLRRRHRRPRHQRRVRLHHPVLHGRLVPPGPRDRRGVQDRPRDEHHLAARRSASRRPLVTAITIGIALFVSHWLGDQAEPRQRRRAQRRRHLRDRGRDDGHAHDHRLHPGDGHVRPDHRQRRRHRRVQPRRGRRPRDHRPPRCRRQHDQGPDQGLRDRLGVARRVPAVLRLHRQDQPHPGPAHRGRRPRRRAPRTRSTSPTSTCSSPRCSRRCSSTSSARSPSGRSAPRPRRSSSRSAASSARCPGSWTTASARTTPGSSTSRPRPRSAR